VSTDLSATTLASYKADVTTARSEVTTAITATETLLNSIVSQKIAVQKTRDELNLQKAGNTTEDVEQAEAKVAEALADVRKAEANVAKTIIRAPFSGVITNKNVSVGQIVAANSPVLSIISLGNFEIEANIPEVEIAKLTVGNTATVTLDAYGNDVPFLATVNLAISTSGIFASISKLPKEIIESTGLLAATICPTETFLLVMTPLNGARIIVFATFASALRTSARASATFASACSTSSVVFPAFCKFNSSRVFCTAIF
jgi:multidrug efflux pump subunit AcrA (membrane-fusion protein)